MIGDELDDLRRKNDIQLAQLVIQVTDFISRYERDSELASVERKQVMDIIKSHDEFIRDIKPMYTRGMIALGAFVLGSIGIAVHTLWSHVKWG